LRQLVGDCLGNYGGQPGFRVPGFSRRPLDCIFDPSDIEGR